MKTVRLDITGESSLLMHSDTLADPTADITKAFKRVSGKRIKTDDDYEFMARTEHKAGLYLDSDGAVCLPAVNLTKCFTEGARITKSGKKIEQGVIAAAGSFPLIYEGPRTPEALYGDANFRNQMTVKVGMSRTVRCRPIFHSWAVQAEFWLDVAVLSPEEFEEIADRAGKVIAVGDYRRGGYGKFSAKLVSVTNGS